MSSTKANIKIAPKQSLDLDFFLNLWETPGSSRWGCVPCNGSLPLERNSEVGEAVLARCSNSCVCTSAFSLPAIEADPQLAMGPFGRWILDISLHFWNVEGSLVWFLEGSIAKAPGMVLRYPFMVSQPNLSALEQSWLYDIQSGASEVRFVLVARTIGLLWETSRL